FASAAAVSDPSTRSAGLITILLDHCDQQEDIGKRKELTRIILINAIGTSENARTAATQDAVVRPKRVELTRLLPPVDGLDGVERMLKGVIETLEFTAAQDERALPGEQESDRFDQAEHEAAASRSTGTRLDVNA
ncbi:MAG: hypothetical protein IID40_10065, partial [Planctomycetes bacterium]|nr:hypothetical protein [Planctomycetota bacterium]